MASSPHHEEQTMNNEWHAGKGMTMQQRRTERRWMRRAKRSGTDVKEAAKRRWNIHMERILEDLNARRH